MGKPYSMDLRERLVAYVEAGHSCRAAARVYDVSCQSRTNMGPLPGVIRGHDCGIGVRLSARGSHMPDACQGALAEGQFTADCVVWV